MENIPDEELRGTELAEAQEKYRILAEKSLAGVYIIQDGRFTYANPEFLRIFGYSREELLEMGPMELTAPEDRPLVAENIRKRLAGELREIFYSSKALRKDGQTINVEVSGTVTTLKGRPVIIGMLLDITQRHRDQQALRESEERFRAMVENTSDWVWEVDAGGRYTYCSPKVKSLLGYEVEEVLGKTPFDLMSLQEADRVRGLFEEKASRALPFAGLENTNLRKDGQEVVLETSGVPMLDSQGKLRGYRGIDRDITQRKRAQEQLRSLNATLEQRVAERTAEAEKRAAQLRALTTELILAEQKERRRIANILHEDFQQLLCGAKMNLLTLKQRLGEAELQAMAAKVDDILDQTIDASRSLTIELRPPVLYELGLVAAMNWLVRDMKEKNILHVRAGVDAAAEPMTDDLKALYFEAARELLSNVARHACVQNASMTLKRTNDHTIQMIVADEGVGFEVGKLHAGHTLGGFGLFSIRERLEMMGGAMTIESKPGHGTRITVTGPVGEKAVPKGPGGVAIKYTKLPQERALPGVPTIRVLIVDDHVIVRQTLANMLQREPDMEVIPQAASDGMMAVELVRRTKPDVVVMDISMPGMDGIEATSRIVAESDSIRVVGLSMHEDRAMLRAMKDAGAVACLSKTLPMQDLIAAIRESVLHIPAS